MNVNHFSAEKTSTYEELGLIVLNSDGTIYQSSGELENDNRTADIIASIIQSIQLYQTLNPSDGVFSNITIRFDDYFYSVQISKKSTISKIKSNPTNAIET